ncbi:VOC family metalloprotein YjdN [Planctobacterium marinum]|uniref:VOC family metalloprotein YjdN n=1 Tax=Planctobacterium marinum TaxID=1631968 RepID=UPI001E46FA8C|nr:VOC family metalloprotein YjdN [Planctobacterium marinum]MCC2607182.1 VOC family metalloprotein YjdN [Planctobacterium marinum]
MQLLNYLNFKGQCEDAINFYQKSLGAEVIMLMRFQDMPPEESEACQMPPGLDEKIMHAELQFGETRVMMSDSPESGAAEFKGFSLSIAADSVELAEKYFFALAEEGKVTMALAPTFWAKIFGMVEDKYGVSWMVNVDSDEMPSM